MKTKLIALLLLSLISSVGAQSDLTNLPNVGRVGAFQVGLWVTDDKGFFERFLKDTKTPELNFINKIERDKTVFVFLLISNATIGEDGNSDVKMTLSTFRPNGGLSYESEVFNAYKGKGLERNRLHISMDGTSLLFDDSDPLGNYTIKAEVKDEISGEKLDLAFPLTVLNNELSNKSVGTSSISAPR